MYIATVASASASLLHAHVPFDEPANLTLGIAAPHHPLDELAVLLFGFAVLFRTERDNRKKVFDLRKYPFLNDFANLFIAGPGRVFAGVLCPRPPRALDDLVAEIRFNARITPMRANIVGPPDVATRITSRVLEET